LINLHVHSDGSLLDAISKPKDIARTCKEYLQVACALTDHGNLTNCVAFSKAMREQEGKPRLGCELYLCGLPPTIKDISNRPLSHLVVLAKNKEGWKNLIKIVGLSNSKDFFYYNPRIDLENLKKYSGDLIAFSGHPGSELANIIFEDYKIAYGLIEYNEVKKLVREDWEEKLLEKIKEYQDIFSDFFLEVQLIDKDRMPASLIIAKILRFMSKKYKIPRVGTGDAHYCKKEDAEDQRVLLANKFNMSLREIYSKLKRGEDTPMSSFFKSDAYHLLSTEEGEALYDQEEVRSTYKIAEMCEDYEITGRPMLPQFRSPKQYKSSAHHLKDLCYKGFEKRKGEIYKTIDDPDNSYDRQTYVDRFKEEFDVLNGFGLSDYFLIVHDIIGWARKEGQITGPGRGSAAGSLILYLLEVTHVDPIRYDLLWARFFNSGRCTKDHVSLPDVDMDFEINRREEVIQYIREKYGRRNVAQISTYTRLQGRSALKEVLRANEASFELVNRMTEDIPDEAEISDQLAELEDKSILRWALKNRKKSFKEWVHIGNNGVLQGNYAKFFEQAIRIEGTKKNQSKHAAGLIISTNPLDEECPMVYDKGTGEMIVGVPMEDAEAMGYVKFDILGVAALDKLHGILDGLSGVVLS